MLPIIVGLTAGILAFLLGWWRTSCTFWEVNGPFNLPMAWRNPVVRVGTWAASTLLSLVFAGMLAIWIRQNVGEFIGNFSFGVLLVLRWQASGLVAVARARRILDQIQLEGKPHPEI